jgi:hypothetical protein
VAYLRFLKRISHYFQNYSAGKDPLDPTYYASALEITNHVMHENFVRSLSGKIIALHDKRANTPRNSKEYDEITLSVNILTHIEFLLKHQIFMRIQTEELDIDTYNLQTSVEGLSRTQTTVAADLINRIGVLEQRIRTLENKK